MQSRRGFIRQSTMWAGASCLARVAERGSPPCAPELTLHPLTVSGTAEGASDTASDADYDTARAVFWLNPETDKHPAIIARCKSEEEVLRCIDTAREYELEVAVRSGNHSFLGWGTCDRGIATIATIGMRTPRNALRREPQRQAVLEWELFAIRIRREAEPRAAES